MVKWALSVRLTEGCLIRMRNKTNSPEKTMGSKWCFPYCAQLIAQALKMQWGQRGRVGLLGRGGGKDANSVLCSDRLDLSSPKSLPVCFLTGL